MVLFGRGGGKTGDCRNIFCFLLLSVESLIRTRMLCASFWGNGGGWVFLGGIHLHAMGDGEALSVGEFPSRRPRR